MAVSVVPALTDALFTQLTAALPNVRVYDGFGVSDDPADFLLIGVDDPNETGMATSATTDQHAAVAGTPRSRDESGDLWCSALSWKGEAGNAAQKSARDACAAVVAAVENLLRTTPNLGLTSVSYLVAEIGSGWRWQQDQGHDGAVCIISFPIHFRARI
jgi:hypothetical protein